MPSPAGGPERRVGRGGARADPPRRLARLPLERRQGGGDAGPRGGPVDIGAEGAAEACVRVGRVSERVRGVEAVHQPRAASRRPKRCRHAGERYTYVTPRETWQQVSVTVMSHRRHAGERYTYVTPRETWQR
eukprot:7894508-Pyramimonas_sp.AAC.1